MKIVNVVKRIVDKLVKECRQNIDRNEMIYKATLNDYRNVCNSCTVCIIFLSNAFLIIISCNSTYFYFLWYLKGSDTNITNINLGTETVCY